MSKYKHTDEFGAPVFKPDLHDKARANKDDNELREQVKKTLWKYIEEEGVFHPDKDVDELITLIRTATLDETFNAVMEACKHPHENVAGCVFTEGTQAQHNLDLKAIDNLRGNDEQ